MNESAEIIENRIADLSRKRRIAENAEIKHRQEIRELQDRLRAMRGLIDPALSPKRVMRVYGHFHKLQSGSIYDVLTVVLNDRTHYCVDGSATSCNLRFRDTIYDGGITPGMFYRIPYGRRELQDRAFPKGNVVVDEEKTIYYRDTEVKWTEKMKVCCICRELIYPSREWLESPSQIAKYWRKDQLSFEDIAELDAMAHSGYITYGIHNWCKPDGAGMKRIIKDYSKGYLSDQDKETMELLAKCWPSFAIHAKRPDKQRILRKWAIRNPSRVSTPAARAFFQIHLGIKNLDSALTKAKQTTHEYNPNAVAKA